VPDTCAFLFQAFLSRAFLFKGISHYVGDRVGEPLGEPLGELLGDTLGENSSCLYLCWRLLGEHLAMSWRKITVSF
jgi:hypothetical protein